MRTYINPLSKEKVLVNKAFLAELVPLIGDKQLVNKLEDLIGAKDFLQELRNDIEDLSQSLEAEGGERQVVDVDELDLMVKGYAKR